ncbi:MAG: FecR domain-containing protein [Planctomycetes bacterium]|nr:FecR domain-containing protein [Planctomycetota bacterium]
MQLTDNNDRLIHILLRQEVGCERPPDLSAKILNKAFPKYRMIFRWSIRAAAAAVIVLSIGWLAYGILNLGGPSSDYPDPVASGAVRIEDGSKVGRGATLVASGPDARIVLGGYCDISLGQGARLKIQGQQKAEEIFLLDGQVACKVDKKIGAFAVKTGVGMVEVTGTVFTVAIDKTGPRDPDDQRIKVSVKEGSVRVSCDWGINLVTAGQEQFFSRRPAETVAVKPDVQARPEHNSLIGVITAKGNSYIMVAPDGMKESMKFVPRWIGGQPKDGGGPDRDMLKVFSTLGVGDKVQILWKQQDEQPRVLLIKVLYNAEEDDASGPGGEPAPKTPEKPHAEPEQPKPPVETPVRPADEPSVPEVNKPDNPPPLPPADPPQPPVVPTTPASPKPDEHGQNEHGQPNMKPAIEEPLKDPPERFAPTKPGEENATARGRLIGVVHAKGDGFIDITSTLSNRTARYLPDIAAGGPDREILKAMASVKVGERVGVHWHVNDKLRLDALVKLPGGTTPADPNGSQKQPGKDPNKQPTQPTGQPNQPDNNRPSQTPVPTPANPQPKDPPNGGAKPGSDSSGEKPVPSGQKPGTTGGQR